MRQRNTNSVLRDLVTLGGVAAAGYILRSLTNGRSAPAQQPGASAQQPGAPSVRQPSASAGGTVSTAPNASFAEGAGSTAIGLDSAPVESRTLPNSKFAPEDDQPY